MSVEWHGKSTRRGIIAMAWKRLNRAASRLVTTIKKNLNRSGPPRSSPGEYPKRDSNQLIKQIFRVPRRKELWVRVGTTLKYGRYLEQGTRKMKRRPWLSLGLKDARRMMILEMYAHDVKRDQ